MLARARTMHKHEPSEEQKQKARELQEQARVSAELFSVLSHLFVCITVFLHDFDSIVDNANVCDITHVVGSVPYVPAYSYNCIDHHGLVLMISFVA